ncbi:hypothetical protein BHE74_00040010 [Ensete ventricosum]|nr:hypothetical protein BHE74_00040010 [Ensete ventricosum]
MIPGSLMPHQLESKEGSRARSSRSGTGPRADHRRPPIAERVQEDGGGRVTLWWSGEDKGTRERRRKPTTCRI